MDWTQLINLFYTSPFFVIILDFAIAYFKNNTPYIKRLYSWIRNTPYKVQMMGVKKYRINNIPIRNIEDRLFKEYSKVKIISRKENALVVLIENMQAPYEILITTDEGELENSKYNNVVQIDLVGSVEFKYRGSDENERFLNVLNNIFEIIEHSINEKPIYSFFTLQADLKNDFKRVPFITEHDKDKCEDTKLDIDKSSKYIKINSKTKDNLYKCLKKNIYKVL